MASAPLALGGPLTFATLYLIFKQLSSDSYEFINCSQMVKTFDTTGFDQNRNSSDSEQPSVLIRDQESELLQARIKKVAGDHPVRAFARSTKVGEHSLRDYMDSRCTLKHPAIEKIAVEGRVSTEWLTMRLVGSMHGIVSRT